MNRWTVLLAALLLSVFAVMSCSDGGGNPVLPNAGTELTNGNSAQTNPQNQTHLWGYYDLYFDFENQTVEAVPNRDIMFSANVVGFVNKPVTNLAFDIWGTPVADPAFIDVDIDVSITHPFPGLHQYDGYDVRGIFMGNGGAALSYGGGALNYQLTGVDQEMKDYNPDATNPEYVDPYVGPTGDPDGWTRWWNAVEFTGPDPLGYVVGKLAALGYTPAATLNPYKYFCDGLTPQDDLWTWLNTNPNSDLRGIFTAGSTNTRNYYLRFPVPAPDVTYGYAICATWGEAPDENPLPENCVEAVTVSVDITDNIWNDGVNDGGNLIADIHVWGWDMSTVFTEEVWLPSTVYVESDVFSDYTEVLGPPAPGGDHFSTWSADIPADGTYDPGERFTDLWVICEYNRTYEEAYPTTIPDAPLAAFFLFDLWVDDEPFCDGPIVNSMDPNSGLKDGAVNCDIDGTFTAGPQLAATLKQGTAEIVGTTVTWVDANTVNADFDLNTFPIGLYDLVMTHDDCPTPTILADAFEIVEGGGPSLKDSGDLPDQTLTSNIIDMNVEGNDGFGYPGVYYWDCIGTSDSDYRVMYHDLDYSNTGEQLHTGLQGNYGFNINGLLGGPQYPKYIEVMATGVIFGTSSYTGPMTWGGYNANGPIWWFASNGLINNGYIYFNMQFGDIEREFGATDRLLGYWGNYPAGVDGASYYCNAPYGVSSYGSYTGYYPADHSGSVDGLISDNEAIRYSVDSDPEELTSPFNIIHYYMEGPPDEYNVEIMKNVSNIAFPVSMFTIDEGESDWTGNPVDISVVNSFGNIDSATNNWLCLLEDNGTTWNLSVWDQNGVFYGRAGPYDGTPLACDVNLETQEPHVWADDGGTYKWFIFTLN